MGSQRKSAAAFIVEDRAVVAREAQRARDGVVGMPLRAQVVQQLAKLGERERACPASLPDPLDDRV